MKPLNIISIGVKNNNKLYILLVIIDNIKHFKKRRNLQLGYLIKRITSKF